MATTTNEPTEPTTTTPARYLEPGWFTVHVFNRLVRRLTALGLSVWGSRVLIAPGRTSGEPRSTVVNVLTQDGTRYLVAPRGQTQWVRNVRAADGAAELRLGRRTEPVRAIELDDDAKVPVIRAYLRKWKAEVGMFFEGLDLTSSDAEVRAVAPGFPVFAIEPR